MSERLRAWLRFDAERVPEVEAAYREYLRHSKPGVAFCVAFVVAFVSAVAVAIALMNHGWSDPRTVGPILVTFSGVFYGLIVFAVARTPLPTLGRVLGGAVSVPRVCVLAIGLGALCVAIEVGAILAIVSMIHATQRASTTVDYFSGGVVAGVLLLVLAAPLAEEFIMQGWLQTRIARLGPFWAAVVTTIVFVLVHGPASVLDLARGVALGGAAWLRATTRSMLACILVHATNNALIAGILLAARAGHQ